MSCGRSKGKRGFCSHGPLADWDVTLQGDKDPPRKVTAYVVNGYLHPLRGEAKECFWRSVQPTVHFWENFIKKLKNVLN